MDTTEILTIEGVQIAVNVYDDAFGGVTAEFAEVSALQEYSQATEPCVSPWTRLVGFRRPTAALRQIGAVVLSLAAGRAVEFEGATGKRLSVYRRMLQRAGVPHQVVNRRGQDVLIVFA